MIRACGGGGCWYPSTPVDESRESEAGPARGINGETSALAIDRAIGELRRGRAIHLSGPGSNGGGAGLVVAAIEAVHAPLLRRLEEAGHPLLLLLTPERARAAGLGGEPAGPVAVAVPSGAQPEDLRALACATPIESDPHLTVSIHERWTGSKLAAAGFSLAKAGRLLPALVGVEVEHLADPSLLVLDGAAVERQARFVRHSLQRTSQSRVPLADALDCELALFRDEHRLGEHVAIIIGKPDFSGIVPVRMHSACLTGDLLGSLRCDCGEQLRTAVRRIAELGGGVLLYLDQEGRGIGLANKLRAYALQDHGLDTIDADRHLGFSADERNYDVAVALLRELGISRITLLTNNPQKIAALTAREIAVVGRLPLVGKTNSHNARYLKAKRERAGHLAGETDG